MRKNGLALAKAALSLPDRQKHAFSGYHRAMGSSTAAAEVV